MPVFEAADADGVLVIADALSCAKYWGDGETQGIPRFAESLPAAPARSPSGETPITATIASGSARGISPLGVGSRIQASGRCCQGWVGVLPMWKLPPGVGVLASVGFLAGTSLQAGRWGVSWRGAGSTMPGAAETGRR